MNVAVKRGDRSTYVLPPVRPGAVGGDSGPTSGSVYIGSVGSPALARARANGQAAFAVYQRDPDRAWNAHAVLVPTVTTRASRGSSASSTRTCSHCSACRRRSPAGPRRFPGIGLVCSSRPPTSGSETYRFDTDDGTRTLAELFDGRSQLLVYHVMFGPSYQAGDPVNSSIADGLNALLPHLHARDVTLLLVSRAPLAKLQAYKRRMGWSLPWVSAANTDLTSTSAPPPPRSRCRRAACRRSRARTRPRPGPTFSANPRSHR
jgi:hypothetical protein